MNAIATFDCATLERKGDTALLLVDNPPLNVLSHGVREAIMSALEIVEVDDTLRAMVIGCAGRSFFVGADIKEFEQGPRAPLLRDVVRRLGESAKPVIAAIHGMALGGGLEIALGCHYRIAAASSRMGLPEVKLGIIPGAGGLQLLPRLTGIEKALEMSCFGRPIEAREGAELGLLDRIAEGSVIASALAFVEAHQRLPTRPTSGLAMPCPKPEVFDEFTARHARRIQNQAAPAAVIRVMRAATSQPPEVVEVLEQTTFTSLRSGPQSKALRYLFQAEREAAKIPEIAGVDPASIDTIGIVGAGTMGTGMAIACLEAGYSVILQDTAEAALQRAWHKISAALGKSAKAGRIDAAAAEEAYHRLEVASDPAALGKADLLIEAAFEQLEVKQRIFEHFARVAAPHCIFATNTSYLDIDAIAEAGGRQAQTLGLHFFSPANVMKLLEIVTGSGTTPETLATAMGLARKLGKKPVVARNAHGFIGNRMFAVRKRETDALLACGATPQEIDRALENFGFAMGPCRVSDLTGLDLGWTSDRSTGETIRERLCEAGRFGLKAGAGFYDYDEQGRAHASPEAQRIITRFAQERGIEQRKLAPPDIRARLTWPMVDAGAVLLSEGVARREADIDVVWVHGYGWPGWTGGPMFYGRQHGLEQVAAELRAMGHEPSPEFLKLAERERS